MPKTEYLRILERISHNVKVIWFGITFDETKDPWAELSARTIHASKSVDVEEMLDRKGFEDAEDSFLLGLRRPQFLRA
jgi:hypothetical protein